MKYYKIQKLDGPEHDPWTKYICSNCGAVVSYGDPRCPASGCGVKFDGVKDDK